MNVFFSPLIPRDRGCDWWNGSYYCGHDAPYVDEIRDEQFCAVHAGPLAWSVCKVNAYTIAVRVAGWLDEPADARWLEASPWGSARRAA